MIDVRDETDALLTLGEGWVIDEIARRRLGRQLAEAPSFVAGVMASTGELRPGASYRVHAERMALLPMTAVSEASTAARLGALVMRPGREHSIGTDGAVTTDGVLLVDHGAHAHNPQEAVGPLQTASMLGRPPFPWRPVVVFLGCSPNEQRAEWARSLVNDLVLGDVEGRLAVLDAIAGPHFTRPCSPDEASISALAPDVIVTLDDQARAYAPAWSASNRATTLIDLDEELDGAVELVSWRVGAGSNRLRARIGTAIGASALTTLVNRLCSGPHPLVASGLLHEAPEGVSPVAPPARPRRRVTARRSVVVVTGIVDTATQTRVAGLLDHLTAAGDTATTMSIEAGSLEDAIAADVVVVRSVAAIERAFDLIQTRQRQRRVTVVDLGASDVMPDDGVAVDAHELTAGAARLVAACGRAVTPSATLAASLRAQGARTLVVPTLMTTEQLHELATAHAAHERRESGVLGWNVGDVGTPVYEHLEVLCQAVAELMEERPEMTVRLVGDPIRMPGALLAHDRVTISGDVTRVEDVSQWSMQVWTAAPRFVDISGDLQPLVDASVLGIPTVLPARCPAAAGGQADPELAVEDEGDPAAWLQSLRSLLDDNEWSRHSDQARQRAEAFFGGRQAVSAMQRFVAWALDESGAT